jgi:hypothetical protein
MIRFLTWHRLFQLFNRFLVYRGACFVAAVFHLNRPAAYCFRVTRAAGPVFSFISSPTRHGDSLFKRMRSLHELAEVWLPGAGAFPASESGASGSALT